MIDAKIAAALSRFHKSSEENISRSKISLLLSMVSKDIEDVARQGKNSVTCYINEAYMEDVIAEVERLGFVTNRPSKNQPVRLDISW